MDLKNCWDVKMCGREPGGAKSKDLGVCPASIDARLDTVNGGKNAGRACWALAGTLCGGKVQGSHASKIGNCLKCDFYHQVVHEQSHDFVGMKPILEKLDAPGPAVLHRDTSAAAELKTR